MSKKNKVTGYMFTLPPRSEIWLEPWKPPYPKWIKKIIATSPTTQARDIGGENG